MTDQKLVDELEKALRDEAYDGGFGYMGDEQFTAYVRTLAETAAEVVEKALTPTDDEREVLIAALSERGFSGSGEEVGTDEIVIDIEEVPDVVSALGFRRSEVPEPSAEPKHDESCAEWCNHCQVCGEGIRYGSRCREHYQNQPQGEPSDAQEPLDLKGLAEIIGDVVVDHADTGPHSQRAITIRDTCADWPDLIAGEVQAQGFRRPLPLSNEALDAAFAAFRAHERGEEFNEFGEHVCSECGYAYSWPSGADGRQTVPARRRQRHIAREALRAAGGAR